MDGADAAASNFHCECHAVFDEFLMSPWFLAVFSMFREASRLAVALENSVFESGPHQTLMVFTVWGFPRTVNAHRNGEVSGPRLRTSSRNSRNIPHQS
jgi:hypothetical protein